MTIVNHETGEVLDLDIAAATRRADQITARLVGIKESFDQVMPKIRHSVELRDDIALGYKSPGHYISERFGAALTGLPVEMRRAAVAELTEVGMSTRAIASVVGVSNKTVSQDRGVTSVTPAPANRALHSVEVAAPVVGLDGKTYVRPKALDHAALAAAAVAEFPDLAYYVEEARDLEHCWRLADSLRGFGADELADRLATLRRSIDVDRSKRNGTYAPPTYATKACPTCGQEVKN